MKKTLCSIFNFLGGVHFAITLIGVLALFVIAGTVIEAITTSHAFAARYTYRHLAFAMLLIFFFINIFFATLRRWPFKWRHIPFLITHLGLLMVIGGCILKFSYGIQGRLHLIEGSGNDEVLLDDSYAVIVEKRVGGKKKVRDFELTKKHATFSKLQIDLIGYFPNTLEKTRVWIHQDQLLISHLKPMPVYNWESFQPAAPVSGKIRLYPAPHEPWDILAATHTNVIEFVEKIYLHTSTIVLSEPSEQKEIFKGTLFEAQKKKLIDVQLKTTKKGEMQNPKILVYGENFLLEIPLSGKSALFNKNTLTPYLGNPPIQVDIHRKPTLAFVQDFEERTHLFAFDAYGRIFNQPFLDLYPERLVVYDEGYKGYAAMAKIPFTVNCKAREEMESEVENAMKHAFEKAAQNPSILALPLNLFYKACKKKHCNFAKTFMTFLKEWDRSMCWIIPKKSPFSKSISHVLKAIEWELVTEKEKNGLAFCCQFFSLLDPRLQQGENPLKALKSLNWPLPLRTTDQDNYCLLTKITKQILSSAACFSSDVQIFEAFSKEQMFIAMMRAYGLHLSTLTPSFDSIFTENSATTLETPLTVNLKSSQPLTKIEDNKPSCRLRVKEGKDEEEIALCYDKTGSSLKWPILKGRYLARFQPKRHKLPYHIRLRQARKINYVGTNQPYSYESKLLFTDQRDASKKEVVLSMNRIYQTKEGYRFFLAGVSPDDEFSVKRIQLIVNYDPVKYVLTYPGALVMSLGIALLLLVNKRGD